MLCPAEVRFVCLSATVNNADELGWLAALGARATPRSSWSGNARSCCGTTSPSHRREDDETVLCPLLHDNGQPGGEGLRIDQAVRRALQGPPVRPLAGAGEGPAPALPRAAAHRDGRGARPARDAAGHRLHLQPRRLRRRRAPGRPRRRPPHRLRRAHRHPPGGRAPGGAAGRRRSARPRLRRVARGPRAWRGGPPCRAGPGLPRDGGGVLRRRIAQGRVRHRDAVARHQHAGPLRRHRALHQVRRGRPGHPHVGRVPAAHGPGRAAWAGRGGSRRRGLVQRDHLRRGRPGGLGPATGPAFGLPAHVQPGRQPRRRASTGRPRAPCSSGRSPSGRPARPTSSCSSSTTGSPSWSTWATWRAGA